MRHDITEPEKATSDIIGQRQERARREIEGAEHMVPESKGQKQQVAEGEKSQRDFGQIYETTEAHKSRTEITAQNLNATRHEKSIECQIFKISKSKRNRKKTKDQAHQFTEAQKGWREIDDQRLEATETNNCEREIAAHEKTKREFKGWRRDITENARSQKVGQRQDRYRREIECPEYGVTYYLDTKGWRAIEDQRHETTEANKGRREITAQKLEVTGQNSTGGQRPNVSKSKRKKRMNEGQSQGVREAEKGWIQTECQRPKATEANKGDREIVSHKREITEYEESNRDFNGQEHEVTKPEKARSENARQRRRRSIKELASWTYLPKLTKREKGRKHDKTKRKIRDQKHQITAHENTKRETVAQEKKIEKGKTFIY